MLWKWQSRQKFDHHCDGLGQTVAIRPNAVIEIVASDPEFHTKVPWTLLRHTYACQK